jgi:6-phosphogluconate dehydrogenase
MTESTGKSRIGVTGLAVMGANLARNIARRGTPTAVHNRTTAKMTEFIKEYGDEGPFTGCESVEDFVNALETPRRIIVMVKAGKPVDAVIEELTPLLDEGDIIIDAGNSHFPDTVRRTEECAANGIRFMGVGVSGGEEGALLGPTIPLTGITEAVFARGLSALRDERKKASTTLSGPAPGQGADRDDLVEDIRLALYASKVVAYAQGFAQMRAASEANDWDLDLGAMATIWRGGCIIRARFLNRIRDAYAEHGDVENLLMVPYFTDAVANAQDAWRRVVVVATGQGVAIPAFSSSLSYYDGYRRERGPANLIQGLRDFFGAHTYQRTDAEGYWHTRWSQDGTEVAAGGQPRSEASGSTSLPAGTDAPASEPDTGPKAE